MSGYPKKFAALFRATALAIGSQTTALWLGSLRRKITSIACLTARQANFGIIRKDFSFMPAVDIPKLEAIDKKLIAYLQEDFPLILRPFQELGRRLSITEKETIKRVSRLKACGIIKRIGPVHDSENLGFKRTLVGLLVPANKLTQVAEIINSFSEVTHNYLREDPQFNLWFTLICPSQKRISAIIKEIKQKSDITKMISLPTIRTIKIRTVFKV